MSSDSISNKRFRIADLPGDDAENTTMGWMTNPDIVTGYMCMPYEDRTWSHELPLYAIAFQTQAGLMRPHDQASECLQLHSCISPVEVNLLLEIAQADATREWAADFRARNGGREPTQADFVTWDTRDPVTNEQLGGWDWLMKINRTEKDSLLPAGVMHTPALPLKQIYYEQLAGADRMVNVKCKGASSVLNYWSNACRGTWHCSIVKLMVDMSPQKQYPGFKESMLGQQTQRADWTGIPTELQIAPQWIAVTSREPVIPPKAKTFELNKTKYTGTGVKIGKCISNPKFDRAYEAEVDTLFYCTPITSQEQILGAGTVQIQLEMMT